MTMLSPTSKALSCAMRILSVRDHSESEVRRKLAAYTVKPEAQRRSAARQHGTTPREAAGTPHAGPSKPLFEQSDIEATLAYCKEHGWLDDARFALHYLRGRSQKGYGAERIKAELRQKGVDKTVIFTVLNQCEIDWFALAQQVAERKCGSSLPRDWAEKAKLQRHLLSRGFSHEEIQAIYTNFSS